jgi:D-threo-aldose 1-dehydrogenase
MTTVSLVLGAAAIGNLYRPVIDEDAAEIVRLAWDAGVREFDTAPHYGLGLSERRLGAALIGHDRDSYRLSTKVGRLLEDNPDFTGQDDDDGFAVPATLRRRRDYSAAGVRASHAASLARLGIDRIDTLYLHDPEGMLDQALGEGLPELARMKAEGLVSRIGIGSKDLGALADAIDTGLVDVAMVAGRYTLLEQPVLERVFPAARRHGTEIVAVGVFNSGLLATSPPSPDAHYEYGPVPADVFARAVALADVCAEFGVELPHAAVQFAMLHPLVTSVAVGIGRTRHVAPNVRWANEQVPVELWTALVERGLVPSEAF